MAKVFLDNVSVEFPIYTSQTKGLINTIMGFNGLGSSRVQAKSGQRNLVVHALREISLNFSNGDKVALIGRNGAGKSTLLRVLSGVYEPTTGHIVVEGKNSALTDLMLGMDPEASGYDFIVTRGVVMGLTSNQAKALRPDIEEFTELGEYLHLPVRTYSSGMLLRLAFAVATATQTEILLMDEMIGVGDNAFLAKATERLTNLMSSVEILVLASHNDAILRQFCNKGILLSEGRVILAGSLDECLQKHNSI